MEDRIPSVLPKAPVAQRLDEKHFARIWKEADLSCLNDACRICAILLCSRCGSPYPVRIRSALTEQSGNRSRYDSVGPATNVREIRQGNSQATVGSVQRVPTSTPRCRRPPRLELEPPRFGCRRPQVGTVISSFRPDTLDNIRFECGTTGILHQQPQC